MASSPAPQNRRKNMDVTKLISSHHEVTVLGSGLDDFDVKFHGPKVWQYRLCIFQGRDTKLESFLAKNQLYSNEITES